MALVPMYWQGTGPGQDAEPRGTGEVFVLSLLGDAHMQIRRYYLCVSGC